MSVATFFFCFGGQPREAVGAGNVRPTWGGGGRWDFWPTFRSFFRFLHWKTSLFRFCRPLQFPVLRFFRKNKGGKIPLWVSVQSDVRLFYVSQFYSQSKSNCNVVCVGRLSTESTPRRPTDFGGNCSSILPFGPYFPQITNKFEI